MSFQEIYSALEPYKSAETAWMSSALMSIRAKRNADDYAGYALETTAFVAESAVLFFLEPFIFLGKALHNIIRLDARATFNELVQAGKNEAIFFLTVTVMTFVFIWGFFQREAFASAIHFRAPGSAIPARAAQRLEDRFRAQDGAIPARAAQGLEDRITAEVRVQSLRDQHNGELRRARQDARLMAEQDVEYRISSLQDEHARQTRVLQNRVRALEAELANRPAVVPVVAALPQHSPAPVRDDRARTAWANRQV